MAKKLKQIVVPTTFREQILRETLESITPRHTGICETAQRLSEGFYWPKLRSDVKRFVRSCDIWNRKTTDVNVSAASMLNVPFTPIRLQRIAIATETSVPLSEAQKSDPRKYIASDRLRNFEYKSCFRYNTSCFYKKGDTPSCNEISIQPMAFCWPLGCDL